MNYFQTLAQATKNQISLKAKWHQQLFVSKPLKSWEITHVRKGLALASLNLSHLAPHCTLLLSWFRTPQSKWTYF